MSKHEQLSKVMDSSRDKWQAHCTNQNDSHSAPLTLAATVGQRVVSIPMQKPQDQHPRTSKDFHCTANQFSSDEVTRLVENEPDYTQVDISGFTKDAWNGLKQDMRELWQKNKGPKP